MEILKGYCAKVRGQQNWQDAELRDELFALFKLAWLENARLLARREGQNYYFLASFLGEEEAARFTENFACRKPTVLWLTPFEAADERGFVPWGQVVPKDVGDHTLFEQSLLGGIEEAWKLLAARMSDAVLRGRGSKHVDQACGLDGGHGRRRVIAVVPASVFLDSVEVRLPKQQIVGCRLG
jgi:hypothetical protein